MCSFWPPTNSTNYRKSIQNFLSSQLENRQWHLQQANHSWQSNPCTEVEAQKEDFNAVSQKDFSSVVQARLQGFGVKIANFSPLYCIAIPRRDLSTKKTKPNNNRKQTRKPQSHVRILIYQTWVGCSFLPDNVFLLVVDYIVQFSSHWDHQILHKPLLGQVVRSWVKLTQGQCKI